MLEEGKPYVDYSKLASLRSEQYIEILEALKEKRTQAWIDNEKEAVCTKMRKALGRAQEMVAKIHKEAKRATQKKVKDQRKPTCHEARTRLHKDTELNPPPSWQAIYCGFQPL